MHLVQLPNQPHFFEVGDMRLSSKWQLSDLKSPVAFSVMPELVTPSGNNKRFLSDDSLGMGVLLLAEKDFGGFRIAANLGYRYSKSAIISGIDFRHRMPVGLGSAIKLSKRLLLNAEIRGFMTLPVSQQQNPGEFYLGLNYHTRKDFALIAGGSIGTLEDQGSLNYRFQGALRMYLSPAPEAAKPVFANSSVKKAKLQGDTIVIADEINFEHNSDRLLASAAAILDDVGELILKAAERIKSVQIEGHTSLVGSAVQNQDLSQRRAKAVEQYLVNVSGVPANLLTAKGYGASRPRFLPGKASRADLERNRRVEFKIIPKQ
jgi:OOP family OmpA-OmpF porin